MTLPDHVVKAIRCGPVPNVRQWRRIKDVTKLTEAEKIMVFAEHFLRVPEGSKVGQPIRLDIFQEAFIYAVFDNPARTRRAVLSIARKNSKTVTCAIILLAALAGPLARENSSLSSGALSRDQAALVFRHMVNFIHQSPRLMELVKVTESSKKIVGHAAKTEYQALSADGSTNLGRSDRIIIGDEWGAVRGPTNEFVNALISSQGAHDDALQIIISTQSPSDADMLSLWIDDAERSQDPSIVCHVYAADEHCDLMDRSQWKKANPALGIFRSERDLEEQLKQAARMPSMEASARNLLLNQRISQTALWIAPATWKGCSDSIDIDVFRHSTVSVGLDLSARNDLTAAVAAAKDEAGNVHLLPFVFCPAQGLEDRSARDRAPYTDWVRDGFMIALPGASMDYQMIAEYLRNALDDLDISIDTIEFDRWRIDVFKQAAEEVGFAQGAQWNEVGQGYKDFSPRCEALESLLLKGQMRHGNHPLLNMAVANAIAVRDPSGNVKLDKSKASQRIDPLVAAVMAAYPVSEGVTEPALDVATLIF